MGSTLMETEMAMVVRAAHVGVDGSGGGCIHELIAFTCEQERAHVLHMFMSVVKVQCCTNSPSPTPLHAPTVLQMAVGSHDATPT